MQHTIKALFFDVFGTLMDWRTSVAREAQAGLEPLGYSLDWLAFAEAWRGEYHPSMEEVRSGRRLFCKLDILHRENLEKVLPRFGVSGMSEAALGHLNLAWHRLDAWPDTAPGLVRLKRQYRIAPCSNGNISLMVDLARRNGLVWDAILGAELARDYKPKPAVYQHACAAFDCAPAQVMMVAAHSSDLQAAAACGLRTAFIARPDEHGPGRGESAASLPVDCSAESLVDLAARLGGG
jgi:2-haloacid dehalogenase